jgi:hypothetical protein
MSEATLNYHWSREEFVRAWEAGVFEHRAELVEGEVWQVVIGDWHGGTVGDVIGLLWRAGFKVMTSTLPAGNSLPDPDCWVKRPGSEPIAAIGSRLSVWKPADVLLVVEVSDETIMQDLTVKERLYGRAGYPVYWVVTQDIIYEHTEPTPAGYRQRTEYRPGERIPLPHSDTDIAVSELLSLPE